MKNREEYIVDLMARGSEALSSLDNVCLGHQKVADASSCRPTEINLQSDMTVYAVVSIALFLMILTISNGTSFYPVVSIVVGTGILLSTILFIADKYSFATRLMHIIKKLDR